MIYFNIVEKEPVLKIEVSLSTMRDYFFLSGVVMHFKGGIDEFNDESSEIKLIVYLAQVNLLSFLKTFNEYNIDYVLSSKESINLKTKYIHSELASTLYYHSYFSDSKYTTQEYPIKISEAVNKLKKSGIEQLIKLVDNRMDILI
jgi:hypothetical protein